MRKINKIIVHCSDSDVKGHDDISIIRGWHVNERNFNDVGYHYFIKWNGTIQTGRALDIVGAHCYGHNKDSIGCLLYTSDAADERSSVDLGGRRILKKKTRVRAWRNRNEPDPRCSQTSSC